MAVAAYTCKGKVNGKWNMAVSNYIHHKGRGDIPVKAGTIQ